MFVKDYSIFIKNRINMIMHELLTKRNGPIKLVNDNCSIIYFDHGVY